MKGGGFIYEEFTVVIRSALLGGLVTGTAKFSNEYASTRFHPKRHY
jgi:hypothetical protein